MVVACVALAVALSGTGYAAVTLKRNSIGTIHLKKNAVTGKKVKNRSLGAADIKKETLFGTGVLVTGLDFRPRSSADTFAYAGGGAIRRTGGGDYFAATIDLPKGAFVTTATFYVVDNDATSMALALTRYLPAMGTSSNIAVFNTAALPPSTDVQTVARVLTTPFVVDNSSTVYRLLADPAVATANHQIVGARVGYTLP